jgi:hypothetical protein
MLGFLIFLLTSQEASWPWTALCCAGILGAGFKDDVQKTLQICFFFGGGGGTVDDGLPRGVAGVPWFSGFVGPSLQGVVRWKCALIFYCFLFCFYIIETPFGFGWISGVRWGAAALSLFGAAVLGLAEQ